MGKSYGSFLLEKKRCSCGGKIELRYSRTGMGNWYSMFCHSCKKFSMTDRMKITYNNFNTETNVLLDYGRENREREFLE